MTGNAGRPLVGCILRQLPPVVFEDIFAPSPRSEFPPGDHPPQHLMLRLWNLESFEVTPSPQHGPSRSSPWRGLSEADNRLFRTCLYVIISQQIDLSTELRHARYGRLNQSTPLLPFRTLRA
jgi:hypothetical protein